MAEKTMKRYRLTFKQQMVWEYDAGASVPSLMRKYGITGNQMIRTWINQHSRKGNRTVTKKLIDPQAQAKLESAKGKVESLERWWRNCRRTSSCRKAA